MNIAERKQVLQQGIEKLEAKERKHSKSLVLFIGIAIVLAIADLFLESWTVGAIAFVLLFCGICNGELMSEALDKITDRQTRLDELQKLECS